MIISVSEPRLDSVIFESAGKDILIFLFWWIVSIRRIGQSQIQLLPWFHRPMHGGRASGLHWPWLPPSLGLLLGGGRDEFGGLLSKLSTKQEHNNLQLCTGVESSSNRTNSTIGISPDPDASPRVDGFGAPDSVPCAPSKAA